MPDPERLQLEGCCAGVCAAQAQAAFRALKGNAFTGITRSEHRDDVEQRLIDICVKGVPNYFGAQRFGIGGSNLWCAALGANQYPVRDRNKRSFGCRQFAVRCLIRLLLSAPKSRR